MAQPTSTPQGTPQYTTFLRALAQISVAQICEGPIGERRVAFDAVQVRAPWVYTSCHGLTGPRLLRTFSSQPPISQPTPQLGVRG
jgi:hypothetical protein